MHDQLAPRISTLTRTVQRLIAGATFLYAGVLVVFLLAMMWWGERSWILSVCMYLPPQGWLVPLVLLTPVSALLRPKLCLWHLLCVGLVAGPFMGWHWSTRTDSGGVELTCLTNNIGENHELSLKPFVKQENPDIIALQDARRQGPDLARNFADSFMAAVGQFVLISRFPIQRSELVSQPLWRGQPVAARFEIALRDKVIAIYNVHLPSPRADFMQLRGLLRTMVSRPEWIRDPFDWAGYPETVAERIVLARNLCAMFEKENLPCIALGDFNTPSKGYIYRLLSGTLTDCFGRIGHGYGLTFPGDSPHPISFFEPWLRIDYVFAGKEWTPVECRVELARRSQHRAVVARLRLASGKGEAL